MEAKKSFRLKKKETELSKPQNETTEDISEFSFEDPYN
jgi:hypothetical protein